jgi:hypothetical protein
MSWFTVADILEQKQCFERGKTGRCSHTAKRGPAKGSNPCDYTQKCIDACTDGFIRVSADEVLAHLESKRCRNKGCNHKGCAEIDNALIQIEARPMIA